MDTSKKYYVAHNNQQHGPMPWNELVGKYPPNALVWTEGMANWQPMSTFMPQSPPPRPPGYQPPPQNVNVSYAEDKYAGFWKRFAAYLIDIVIIWVVVFLLGLVLLAPFSQMQYANPIGYAIISMVLNIVAIWLYYAFFESSEHQGTPGKMILKIKVVDLNGDRISFEKATGRYFGKIISSLILGIGYLMVLWTPQKQGLHDQMANTLVVNKDDI